MRSAITTIFAVLMLALPLPAATQGKTKGRPAAEFASAEQILQWINGYRHNPEPARLSAAVQAMNRLGLLRDPDTTGVYIGFMAGVIGDNPKTAETLIAKMFPMPPEEQVVIIKAIAYSGLADWKSLLSKFVERMPARRVLIEQYFYGKAKVLAELPLDTGATAIDAHWGYYFATGYAAPVLRIMSALPWSQDKSDLNKLTIGSMAKWTLATNATRDKDLLDIYREQIRYQPKEVATPLREVIAAAESHDTARIRQQAVAAIEELKRNGPPKTGFAWWANTAATVISVGCVAATVTGHAEIAVPCIITGAVTAAAGKLLGGQ
ncbi:MAG: hypothetical protein ACREC6_14270 [Hyphomicrobiaceae bacterium]